MSGQTENWDDLPNGWTWTTVGNISKDIQYGYTASATAKPSGAKFLRITDIQDNAVNWETVPYCQIDESQKKKFLLNRGDLVFARTGATVGKSFLINGKIPESVFASYLIRICLDPHIDTAFVSNFFQSHLYWKQIHEGKAGIGQPNVNATKLSQIAIPLPPLPEQHRIVSKVEELFTKLGAGVDELKRAKARLRRYRQMVLKYAFEGKLTEDWRERNNIEHVAILLEQIRNERKQIPKPKSLNVSTMDTSGLPFLPEGWMWTKLESVGDIIGGLTKNAKRQDHPLQLPYLRVANVYAGELRLEDISTIGVTDGEVERVLLKKGDLLVVEGNGSVDQIGRVALWDGSISPCVHQNHLIKVRFDVTEIGNYVLYWLLSSEGRKHITQVASSTSGLHTLSISKVSALPVPLCSVPEQQQIVQEIERHLSVIEKTEEMIEHEVMQSHRLRQSTLHKAFSGKLVPQDPSDEPAERLLEQIRKSTSVSTPTRRKRKSNGDTLNGK